MIVAQWIDRSEYGAGGRPLRRAAGRALLSDTARLLGLGGLRVRRRPGQRPEAETPGVWFSMSHTGDLTVCAVATSNVAIDIEQQNARRERRMVSGPPVRFFTAAERELIARDPSRLLPSSRPRRRGRSISASASPSGSAASMRPALSLATRVSSSRGFSSTAR